MNQTAIAVLMKAADLGLKLGLEPPDTLTVEPAEKCPSDFANILRTYKPQLLGLLRLPFVMVESQILEETIFFCQDDDTKAALIEAGADCSSIYTRDELRTLCEANRVAPFYDAELRKVHDIKKTFHGRSHDGR